MIWKKKQISFLFCDGQKYVLFLWNFLGFAFGCFILIKWSICCAFKYMFRHNIFWASPSPTRRKHHPSIFGSFYKGFHTTWKLGAMSGVWEILRPLDFEWKATGTSPVRLDWSGLGEHVSPTSRTGLSMPSIGSVLGCHFIITAPNLTRFDNKVLKSYFTSMNFEI